MAETPPVAAWKLAVRGVLFFGLVAFLIGSPTIQQFGPKKVKFLHSWALYHKMGTGVCVMEFRDSDGKVMPRYELAGLESPDDLSPSRRLVKHGAGRVGRELSRVCREAQKTRGKDVVLHANVRCGDAKGWVEKIEDVKFCKPRKPRKKKKTGGNR